ncbi:MAG: GntR family transcriptional regulator, partial [Ilumatobacteraceae bacterium]
MREQRSLHANGQHEQRDQQQGPVHPRSRTHRAISGLHCLLASQWPRATRLRSDRTGIPVQSASFLLDQLDARPAARHRPHPQAAKPGSGASAAIRDGRLNPGDAIPSSRGLAADLDIARATVVAAYDQLVAEGYLFTRPGALTRVATGHWEPERPVAQPDQPNYRLDLIPGEPDVGRFPRAAWLRCTREVMATAPDELLGYGDPSGLAGLRIEIAKYLNRTRNTA